MTDNVIKFVGKVPLIDRAIALPVHNPSVGLLLGWNGYAERAQDPNFRARAAQFEGGLSLPYDDFWNEWQFGDANDHEGFHVSSDRSHITWHEIEEYGADPALGRLWLEEPEKHAGCVEETDPKYSGAVAVMNDPDLLRDFETEGDPSWQPMIGRLKSIIGRQQSGLARGLVLNTDDYVSGLFVAARQAALDFDNRARHVRVGYVVTPTVMTLPLMRRDLVEASAAAAMYRMAFQDVREMLRQMPNRTMTTVHMGAFAGKTTAATTELALQACTRNLAVCNFGRIAVDFVNPTMRTIPD
ncbi:hypothetical protein ACVIGB_001018 [Bradyrhizobium sp. USDA 4341]